MTHPPRPATPEGQAGLDALLASPWRALIATDFDGTLAPIVADPRAARSHPGAVPALRRLAKAVGTLAVITGRCRDQRGSWRCWSRSRPTWGSERRLPVQRGQLIPEPARGRAGRGDRGQGLGPAAAFGVRHGQRLVQGRRGLADVVRLTSSASPARVAAAPASRDSTSTQPRSDSTGPSCATRFMPSLIGFTSSTSATAQAASERG